jgi:hypothetical protein
MAWRRVTNEFVAGADVSKIRHTTAGNKVGQAGVIGGSRAAKGRSGVPKYHMGDYRRWNHRKYDPADERLRLEPLLMVFIHAPPHSWRSRNSIAGTSSGGWHAELRCRLLMGVIRGS